MPIISVRDNENNMKEKRKSEERGTKAIAKGWELNDFVERLS